MKTIASPLYTVPVVATDVVIFKIIKKKLHVLLIQMKKEGYIGKWAAPGGLVQDKESLDDAAMRHVIDKTGLDQMHIEQLYTFGEPNRDPFGRVVSVAYMALLPSDTTPVYTTDEYSAIRWFPVSRLPNMAYDHFSMIRMAVDRLKSKLEYSNIVFGLLPEKFPLSELREVYESILGRELDKRNFRKKVLSLGIIKDTDEVQEGVQHRPPKLYTFVDQEYRVCSML